MRWPWQRRESVAPQNHYAPVATYLQMQGLVDFGAPVTEESIFRLSPFYRALSLVAGQLAALPFETFTGELQNRKRVPSVFDDPDPGGQVPFAWKETLFLHLITHGRAGAVIQRRGGPDGPVAGLPLAHPSTWKVRAPRPGETKPASGRYWFDVQVDGGKTQRMDQSEFWYVPGMSVDGRDGISLLDKARLSLQTTLAADRATGRMFSHGAMIGGVATPADAEEDIDGEVDQVKREIRESVEGWENAGRIAVLNQRIKLQPWSMTSRDAEFLSSRQFQIEEASRWTGVPPHLLMQTEKQTSWGTGVEEQNRALGRSVLEVWANRLEEHGSRLLDRPRSLVANFSRLERSSPDREAETIRADWDSDMITLNEARARKGLPPVDGGNRRKSEMTAASEPAAGEGGGTDGT